MAGDWIKVEHATATKPEILQMADLLGTSADEVLGLVIRFWCWVDQQMSGFCPAVYGTNVRIDLMIGRTGFAQAMIEVGWLECDGQRIKIPNYEEHLSQSSKARALEAKRKKIQRQKADKCPGDNRTNVPPEVGQKPDQRREEKRREEEIKGAPSLTVADMAWDATPGFDELASVGRFFAIWKTCPWFAQTQAGIAAKLMPAFRRHAMTDWFFPLLERAANHLNQKKPWNDRRFFVSEIISDPSILERIVAGDFDVRDQISTKPLPRHLTDGQ